MSEKAENKQKEAVAYGLTNNALTQAASNVSRITYSNYNYTIVTTLYITFMYIGSRYLPSLNYLEEQSEGVKGWLKSCFKIDFKIQKKIIDEHFTYIHSVIVFFVRNRPPFSEKYLAREVIVPQLAEQLRLTLEFDFTFQCSHQQQFYKTCIKCQLLKR